MKKEQKYIDFTRRCKMCVIPEVKGRINFDENGFCPFCHKEGSVGEITGNRSNSQFINMPEKQKKEILIKKLQRYSCTGKYNCLVAVSGGKDSIMTLYIAHQMGLKPIALFVDNGFALPEMYDNIENAVNILNIDLLIYRTNDMKIIFRHLLKSRKNIYYCRVCHILLENIIKDIAKKYGIKLILGGYTKGQSYVKQEALSWIFKESDLNTLEVIQNTRELQRFEGVFLDPIKYTMKQYPDIVQISPFKYLNYNEEKIMTTLKEKLKFQSPRKSWPKDSTNCFFNYVSQYLAIRQFGYSQHETELSDLIRSGEMSRERANQLINTPITNEDLEYALDKLDLKIEDII